MTKTLLTFLATFVLLSGTSASAADLTVIVKGIASDEGEISCALHDKPASFPMQPQDAKTLWVKADRKGVTCKFTDLKPGIYAVAVFHDVNHNRIMDTNFLGIPAEDVAVSNNVHPKFRAPRFDEAQFRVIKHTRAEILLN